MVDLLEWPDAKTEALWGFLHLNLNNGNDNDINSASKTHISSEAGEMGAEMLWKLRIFKICGPPGVGPSLASLAAGDIFSSLPVEFKSALEIKVEHRLSLFHFYLIPLTHSLPFSSLPLAVFFTALARSASACS
jgi:hypothetical protein